MQAQAIFAGVRPVDDLGSWGYEVAERWGTLSTADGTRRVPSAQGRYADYYTSFAAAVAGVGPQPVPAAEAVATLAVLDAARLSAAGASQSHRDDRDLVNQRDCETPRHV